MAEVSSQTLHIVARELASELNDARAALETFGEQQDNIALLRKCNEHLHSVHGALRVAEVYGAALLAEEMRQVARYLIEHFNEKRHLAEGLDALMRAMVQLPTYLERVLSGGRDMALVLLPLLNDLRAVRGHALLSEGTLLLLNLSSDQQANPVQPGDGALTVSQWARKLRTRFQLGLLGWIKGERVEQNLEVLSRAAEKLEQVAHTQPVFQLWWVIGAVLEALREGGLEGSASIKRLLGQADRELKRLYESGEARYAETPALELLNNLLYYVARARSSGPRVAAVRASFRLGDLLPIDDQVEQARESLSAPSVKLMKTVAAAIKEDLSRVKDALDIFVRQGGTQVDELAPQLDLLKKIGDTLGVLGLGDLREKVQTETNELTGIVQQRVPATEGTLLRMAATLIKVEDSLDEQLVGMIVPSAPEHAEHAPGKLSGPEDIEFRQVTEAVLRECIVNMARIKEAIALSVEKPREAQAIDQIPQLLRGITAGLLMLGKTRVVEIVEGIGRALTQFVRSDGMTLPQDAVDRLADAIVAVEYYMETLQAGRADPWYMLDNAETCLRYLAETQPVPRSEAHLYAEPTHTLVLEPLSQTVASPTEHERTAVIDRGVTPAPAPQAAPTALTHAGPKATPEREIDPEFLELFIEEAKDEIAKIQQLFPRWDENPQDQDALVNFRRSFHTLKGSGRMVGAQLIGEFAWSVENLLNRVINKTLDRTPDMMTMLRQAVGAVPELVEQLETGRAPKLDVAKLIAQANALAGVRAAPTAPAAPTARAAAPASAPTARAAPPVLSTPAAQPAAAPAEKKTAAAVMDPALHEIYSKETAGHLATIREYIAACELAVPPYPVTEDLHRSCHTLSGTAKTAGARQGIKVAEPLNRYIRKLHDNSMGLPAAGLGVLREAVDAIQQVVDHIDEDTGFFVNQAQLVARLNELDHAIDVEISRLAETLDVGTAMASATAEVPVLAEPIAPAAAPVAAVAPPAAEEEPLSVTDVFAKDAIDSALESAAAGDQQYDVIELEPTDASTLDMLHWSFEHLPPLQAAEETIEVSDATAISEGPGPQIAASLETEGDTVRVRAPKVPPVVTIPEEPTDDADDATSSASVELTSTTLAKLSQLEPPPEEVVVETEAWAAEFEPPVLAAEDTQALTDDGQTVRSPALSWSASQSAAEVPAEEIVVSEEDVEDGFVVSEDPADIVVAEEEIELEFDAQLADDALLSDEQASELYAEEPVVAQSDLELFGPAARAHELVDAADVQSEVQAESDLVYEAPPELDSMIEPVSAAPAIHSTVSESAPTAWQAPPSAPVAAPEEELSEDLDADFDPEVAAIFTEEATELLETADRSLSDWIRDRSNTAHAFELKRALHTIKGGARMAGIRAMGDLSHELESFMQLVEAGQVPAEQRVFDALQASLDELHRMRDIVSSGQRCASARELINRIRGLAGLPVEAAPAGALSAVVVQPPIQSAALPAEGIEPLPAHEPIPSHPEPQEPAPAAMLEAVEDSFEIDVEFAAEELTDAVAQPQVAPVAAEVTAQVIAARAGALTTTVERAVPEPADESDVPAIALPPGREQSQTPERQEFARVDAELLDTLLNNAGEVSIFRSRLEQQVSSIEFNLAELGRTVTRLKEQLRKLELETEAQILHRHEDERPGREDFDPLELDRYSTIQQLSRAFAESVSDVASIEGLLENLSREAQNLLLQQARVVTELQNGLMRTRMVPFQRHVQRLSRLVRQVATDTGKRAELVVEGASGELDRQVLERMLPPFEHMLRNSVVHGIETPPERLAKGKPESGTIKVGLHREGSEMVIVLQDDGRGIDVNAVRERAIARGLLQPGRMLTDEEALQLILEPGFSTASAVTQHAGRGVGMDVVVTEIKKLGGALYTESQFGQGVKFTIRLPFTLAITQALIVRSGEELYALPLPSVEGVARVMRSEVQQHLTEETPTFSYGGQVYRFQHLGAFIGGGPSVLPEGEVPVPVVLIRAGEHSTAIVADELVGNREMVVKSVGPQIATIRGIAGATILGDGRIILILDMHALVRAEWRTTQLDLSGPKEDKRTFALVVDDSITVRRVTQRLLERNGMRVMTAKDGVDALSILQEHLPDVILLDIEMPRMDGYELATQVRADARLADIPIVMITSRVGEKHRARAIEIGVNDYLGKPYQENQLLNAIEPLVQARRRKLA